MLRVKHSRAYSVLYNFIKFILRCIFLPIYRVERIGIDKMPGKGRVVICSNHISYLDPVIIGAFIPGCIYFIAKKELYSNKFVSSLVTFLNAFPVDRQSFSMKVFKTSFEVLENENALGLFPEGTRSPDGILGEGKRGVGFIAVHTASPILPVAISGTNKIIQKPHRRMFFPKIKLIAGDLIETNEIIKKYGKKESVGLVFEKTMKEIKRLYDLIK
jgi:1-acyl-sn-glycerol-3-phosphate acyltransferase